MKNYLLIALLSVQLPVYTIEVDYIFSSDFKPNANLVISKSSLNSNKSIEKVENFVEDQKLLDRVHLYSPNIYGTPTQARMKSIPKKLQEISKSVALFGDSTSLGSTFSSLVKNISSAKVPSTIDNMFQSRKKEDVSLLHLLSLEFPVYGENLSIPGSSMFIRSKKKEAVGNILNINFNLERIVNNYLSHSEPADLNIFWTGHNDVDWVEQLPKGVHPDSFVIKSEGEYGLTDEAKSFINSKLEGIVNEYIKNLKVFIDRAKKKKTRSTISVFGLLNSESFIHARTSFEPLAIAGKVPFFFPAEESYLSLKKEYLPGMGYMCEQFNTLLQKEVDNLASSHNSEKLFIHYSTSISDAYLPGPEYLSSQDGWHYSPKGHEFIAQKMYEGLNPALEFIDRSF